jgi:hypothetical protein
MNWAHLSDLAPLLASGIPIDLPDGKRLGRGVLKPKSPYAGQSVQKSFPVDGQEDLEVVAIFRERNTLLPHSGIILQAVAGFGFTGSVEAAGATFVSSIVIAPGRGGRFRRLGGMAGVRLDKASTGMGSSI